MKVPEIYIVGFQKCGSSSLADLLGQHPQLELSNPKETFYLVDKKSKNYIFTKSIDNPNINWSQFYQNGTNQKIRIEASVNNFYQETALNYIFKQKKAKVIFILRSPIDRLWSTYQFYGKTDLKLKNNLTFGEYINLIREGQYNNEGMRFALEHGFYSKYIDKWINKIGEERILIVGLKPLVKDTTYQLQRICNFLNIQEFSKIDMPLKNTSKELRWPGLSRFLYKKIGGNGVGRTMIGKLFLKLNKTEIKEKMPLKQREYYRKFYESEFERYSEYF